MKKCFLFSFLPSLRKCRCADSKEILTPAINMPPWLEKMEKENLSVIMASDEEKMRFVIELACRNVEEKTGGPFAAAVFDLDTGKLTAAGVNSVVPAGQSWAHAEMTAYSRAQYKLGTLNLKNCMLATSCEPCAMCYGATPWSGVAALLYGAPGTEARAIGFDEGDKPENWEEALRQRGIKVSGPMLQMEAKKPFQLYQQLQGKIY